MMRKTSTIELLTLALVFSVCFAITTGKSLAQTFETEKAVVIVEKIVAGIDTPWAMAMLPDGNLLVTLRDGKLLLIDPAQPESKTDIAGIPEVAAFGQGGLLDVVLDPDFELNRKLYLSFSQLEGKGNAGTAIASATLDRETASLADLKILYSMDKKTSAGRHFGSRIVPDGKGHLFFTIGDRGKQPRAQDPFDPAGSVMRIKTDGTIPEDNPFVDGKKALPEIWSIGHRNPQGAALNPYTKELWTQSHGARGGDEINIPKAGKNYGWPVTSYGRNYSGTKIGVGHSAPGMEQPISYWDPSIAPSGMAFYEGGSIPEWKGSLFIGALKSEYVSRLEIDGNKILSEERLFEEEFGRIRDVRSFHDGNLWFLTDESDGAIYRVRSAE